MRRPGLSFEPVRDRQTKKPERALRAFRRDTARPFNCHDPDARRTGHLESARLLRRGAVLVKSSADMNDDPKANHLSDGGLRQPRVTEIKARRTGQGKSTDLRTVRRRRQDAAGLWPPTGSDPTQGNGGPFRLYQV